MRLVTSLVVTAALVQVVAACTPATGSPGNEGEGEGEAGEVVDDGPCSDVGAGLTLAETGPGFAAGGSGNGLAVLMGGGVEVDRASALFVDGAGGGDVLVLRASGSTSSYTGYFDGSSGELSDRITVPASSVATVRVDDADAGADDALLCRVRRADGIWLAGGDQSDYLLSWPGALHDALRDAIARGIAVGGTSAGAMALSQVAYDAEDGGIDSQSALASPATVSVSRSPFPAVAGVVVDTHFQARDREGRLLAFVAAGAALLDGGGDGLVGIGLDEETALVIDGADARVLADDGGSAWLYRLENVDVAGALSADVARVAIGDGDTFTLPGDFRGAEAVIVVDGVVR